MTPERRAELLMLTPQGRAVLEAETVEFARRAAAPKEYPHTTERGARYRLLPSGKKDYEPKSARETRQAAEKAGGGSPAKTDSEATPAKPATGDGGSATTPPPRGGWGAGGTPAGGSDRLKGMSEDQLKQEVVHHAGHAVARAIAIGASENDHEAKGHQEALNGHLKAGEEAQAELKARNPAKAAELAKAEERHAEVAKKAKGKSDEQLAIGHSAARGVADGFTMQAHAAKTGEERERHLANAHGASRVADAYKNEMDMRRSMSQEKDRRKGQSSRDLEKEHGQHQDAAARHRALAAKAADGSDRKKIHESMADTHSRIADSVRESIDERKAATTPTQAHHEAADKHVAAMKDHELQEAVRGHQGHLDQYAEKVRAGRDNHADTKGVRSSNAIVEAGKKEMEQRAHVDRVIANRPSSISDAMHQKAVEATKGMSREQVVAVAGHHISQAAVHVAREKVAGNIGDRKAHVLATEYHNHLAALALRAAHNR